MKQLPAEKLNDFVDKVIEPHSINCGRVCDANSILDWLMQKSWSESLSYTSYPDETVHTVKEGLKRVFDLIQDLDASIREMRALYNEELYNTYKLLDKQPNTEALETLEKIKALLS